MALTLELVDHRIKFADDVRALDIFKIGSYTVNRVTVHEGGKLVWSNVTVFSKSDYAPEIRYDDWSDKKQFKIQTTAYGALDAEEIKKVIAGYEEALEVVKVLTEKFC